MRFFHTLWTNPLNKDSIASTIINFTASATLIKKIGGEIVLHTDDFGYELLKHIEYDKYYLDLNGLNEKLSKYFWAYGKLYATNKEPIGSVHIDGDVFIKNPNILKAFDGKPDIVVQSTEDSVTKKDDCYLLTQNVYNHYELPEYINIYWDYAYNCGVVQLNSKELKNKYLNLYFNTVNKIINDKNLDKYIEEENKKGNGQVIMDIVPEQQFLHQLCTDGKYKVRRILYEPKLNAQAIRVGYAHMCGPAKNLYYDKIKQMLYNIDSNIYYKTIERSIFKQYETN